ncbi:MAG TPA: BON domain-containing protein [Bryobacteraceae bacterium]|nr:BON domain-containing protein [Bryobacteraceae bacterium]
MIWRCAVLFLALFAVGCQKKPVVLGVDLYVHPEASTPDDIMLQAAISKEIAKDLAPNGGLVHVQVVECVVFLSGSVVSDGDHQKAHAIAQDINLSLDGVRIATKGVHDDKLHVAP